MLFRSKGNMPLKRDFTPKNFFPDCIRVKPLRGLVLNSVGLSNPGLSQLLLEGKWQERTSPFFISIMSTEDNTQKRLSEIRALIEMLREHQEDFSAPFGLQINLSCPNTAHDPRELIGESEAILDIAGTLGVPVMPKYSIASAPIDAILKLQSHPACDAICVSNTLPFGWRELDWKKIWGTNISPLAKLGGGGLSGAILCPLVCDWIWNLRKAGFTKPINGGGGILFPEDVTSYHDSGASSIFLGSVATLRPWRVGKIIQHANTLNWR